MSKQVTADDIIKLKTRLQDIRVESAKLETQRENALRAQRAAKTRLKELGIDPENARAELEKKYATLVKEIEELEDAVGLH